MNYTSRAFLNPDGSPLNGTIHCYAGESDREKGKLMIDVAIADCYQVAHLHPKRGEPISEFIKKLETLEKVIKEFREYLAENNNDTVYLDT
jgi:hypothetical protein